MAASYPTSVKSFSTKSTTDTVEASHPNDIQDEVTAIETALLTGGVAHHLFPDTTSRTLGTSAKPWGTTYISALAYIGDTANANMTSGLTLNQGASDDEIFALKSSDVAHGMTSLAETDTYANTKKAVAASGGIQVEGYTEATKGIVLAARHTTDDTLKTTAAAGPIHMLASLKTGTTADVLGANANIVTIAAHGTTRFIFDNEGSAHADVEWTTFDTHDDLALLDTLDRAIQRRDAVTNAFGEVLKYNAQALEEAGIVRFYDDGPRAMLNLTRLSMLLTGAARQTGREIAAIKQALVAHKLLPEAI